MNSDHERRLQDQNVLSFGSLVEEWFWCGNLTKNDVRIKINQCFYLILIECPQAFLAGH